MARTSERAELCEQRRVVVADASDATARQHVDRPTARHREGRQVKRQSTDTEVQERQREQQAGVRRRTPINALGLATLHRIPSVRLSRLHSATMIAYRPTTELVFLINRTIWIPLSPSLSDRDVDDVIEAVQQVLAHFAR